MRLSVELTRKAEGLVWVRNIAGFYLADLDASGDMKLEIFQNKPMIPYRRQKKGILRIIWLGEGSTDKGMKKCGKSLCQICK